MKPYNRKHSLFNTTLTITLSASLLTGCSVSNKTTVNESTESAQISFSWWGNDPRHLYTMEGVDSFMSAHPDIEVDYRYGIWNGFETRNKVYMNSHTASDVMQINYNWLSQYSPDGNGYYDLYQLTDYIDLSGFTQDDLSFGEVAGKLNALPIAYNSAVIYYNEDIFKNYNLPLPKTWDDLFEVAKIMSLDGIYPIGAVKKHIFLMVIANFEQTHNKSAFSSDGICQLTTEDMVYMLDFYKSLIDQKVILPVDSFDRNKLSTGELAGSIFWISDVSNYCSSIESHGTPILGEYLNTATDAPLKGWFKKPATMYAISNTTDYPEASATLLNFLINDAEMATLQGTEKGIPVSSHALSAIESAGLLTGYSVEANTQMIEAGDALHILLPVLEDEEVIEIFKSESDAYIYNKCTAEEAANNILKVFRTKH